MKKDISVILNAHREGRLITQTIKSIRQAILLCESKGVSVEFLVVLDKGDDQTREALHKYSDIIDAVYEVNFADTGLSRNKGIEVSVGKYISFIDGDDLYAKNWLMQAYLFSVKNPDVVVHPEYTVCFELHQLIFKHKPSIDCDINLYDMLVYNHWTALCFAPRRIFEKTKYAATATGSGFGYEDMHWYTQVLAKNIDILVIPDACMFIRRKYENSRLVMHAQAKAIIPKTPLFDNIKILQEKNIKNKKCKSQKDSEMSFCDKHIIKNSLLARHSRVRRIIYKVIGYNEDKGFDLSKSIINQWKQVNKIEPQLFPPHDLTTLYQHQVPQFNAGKKYIKLISQLSYETGIDYVFFVPWLEAGGADLVSTHYMNAVHDLDENSKIVVILTDKPKCDNILLEKIKGNVQIIKFYELYNDLSDCDAKIILARLMIQMRPKYLHVINSRICFEMLCDNIKAVKQYTKIFVSFFCTEINSEGRIVGYPYDYLPRLYDDIDMVYSDNACFMNYLVDLYGLDKQKMIEHYQPFLGSIQKGKTKKLKKDKLHILWASRIDRQKRPDILLKIIKKSQKKYPSYHFHIFGYVLFQDDGYIEKFKECDNVTFHGQYDGKIPGIHEKYDVYLYTSEYDGIPSVLIESMASGVPVIAPHVGGIGELVIDQETGLLISQFDSVDEYLEKLEYVNDNYDSVVQYAKNAQMLLSKRHSWNNFLTQLEHTNYFTKK